MLTQKTKMWLGAAALVLSSSLMTGAIMTNRISMATTAVAADSPATVTAPVVAAPGGKPAIVIELKYDKTTDTAISQIKNRHYPDALTDYSGELLLVAINYNPDTKQHTCSIESLVISESLVIRAR